MCHAGEVRLAIVLTSSNVTSITSIIRMFIISCINNMIRSRIRINTIRCIIVCMLLCVLLLLSLVISIIIIIIIIISSSSIIIRTSYYYHNSC